MYPVHMNSAFSSGSQMVMEIPQNFWENLCKLQNYDSDILTKLQLLFLLGSMIPFCFIYKWQL